MSSIRTLTLKFVKTSKVISTLSETCCYRYLLDFGNISLLNLLLALSFSIYCVVGFFFFFHVAWKSKITDLLGYLIIFAHRQIVGLFSISEKNISSNTFEKLA